MKTILSICICLLCLNQAQAQNLGDIRSYFLVELIPNEEVSFTSYKRDSIQTAHMKNIRFMAEAGQLVLAGPFKEGGGILVLKVPNKSSAESLCKKDPAISAGRFKYRVREWATEKSMLTLDN